MENITKKFSCALCVFFAIWLHVANAQVPHKKPVAAAAPIIPKENYLAHELIKNGKGDYGLYFDTVASKISVTDPTDSKGRSYQDIKITLDAGDVLKVDAQTPYNTLRVTLLSRVNDQLTVLKPRIDTSSIFSKVFFKATTPGIYTLRVSGKKSVWRDKYEKKYFYDYQAAFKLSCIIATPESAILGDNAVICEQVQFLNRQHLTDYMLITGAITDTTMDVLDKKKIGFINHASAFTFYKNSQAKITMAQSSSYIAFQQMLLYKDKADAAQAQRYFIENFKKCLGPEWKGAINENDSDLYEFKSNNHRSVSIILYRDYNYLEIIM